MTDPPPEVEHPAGRPPRWIVVTFLVALVAVAVVGAGSWLLIQIRHDAAVAECEREVEDRDDERTMWLWLIDRFPGENADAALAELDMRLPPLRCDDTQPVPTR